MSTETSGIHMNRGLLILFGIILLAIGLFASFYQETHYFLHIGYETVTPYQSIGIVLDIAGIVFIALGFLIPSPRASQTTFPQPNASKTKEESSAIPPPPPPEQPRSTADFVKKCINCGREIPSAWEECQYCKASQRDPA